MHSEEDKKIVEENKEECTQIIGAFKGGTPMTENVTLEIQSSHLALRFYAASGWTEELLKSCMDRGDLKFNGDTFGVHGAAYWVLQCGGSFDIESLLAIAGPVHDYHGNVLSGDAAKAYVTEMNW